MPSHYKTRKHYNQLVLEIYRAVWEETQLRMSNHYETNPKPGQPWNRSVRDRWRELVSSGSLPIKWTRKANMAFSSSGTTYPHTVAFAVAQRLILKHWLLVFDEVQLLDVSSATLLADVLSWFWRMGGVIVGTSNKVPDDLYKNGVQRERLEPFVEAMKVRCPVITMRNEQDWRQARAKHGTDKTWYTWDQLPAFEHKLAQLCADEHGMGGFPDLSMTVHVLTVSLHLRQAPKVSRGQCLYSGGQCVSRGQPGRCASSLSPSCAKRYVAHSLCSFLV